MVDWRYAIEKRLIGKFQYNGLTRVVIPAVYGRNRKTGNHLLRAFQIGGADSDGTVPVWRLFDEAKMVDASLTGETFVAYPTGYRPDDRSIDVVYAQL